MTNCGKHGWMDTSPNAKGCLGCAIESASSTGSEFRVRVTRLSVLPPKEPLFSEQCTHVSIVDEAAGEFVEIEQQSGRTDAKVQTVSISPKEWPALKQAIEQLLADCETQNSD